MTRYIAEAGSDLAVQAMADDRGWAASVLAGTEAQVVLCRRGPEGAPNAAAQRDLSEDFDRFITVSVDAQCLSDARDIGCRHAVRTLDAIHLAAALRLPSATLLSFDERQCDAARTLGLEFLPT